MRRSNRFVRVAFIFVAATLSRSAVAQTSDNNVYNVVIPSALSIVAPITEIKDMTAPANQADGAVAFLDIATWQCTCNNGAGASVQFVAQGPFANAAGGTPIDAQLSIYGISSDPNSVWSVTTINDSTSGTGTTATVEASSTGPGSAEFDVDIVFNNPGLFTDLVAGTYTTTVVGTITPN